MIATEKEKKEYYNILNIETKADISEIKKAYKKLAMQYHPDRNKEDNAEDKFKEISKAYQVLSDPEKRKQYDIFGNVEDITLDGNFHFDIFNSFFGDISKSFQSFTKGSEGMLKSENRKIDISISLSTLYFGKIEKITYKKKTRCTHCKGSGAENNKAIFDCTKCFGQGILSENKEILPGMVQRINKKCNSCEGSGKMIDPTQICKTCKGEKIITIQEQNEIYIEPGMDENDTLIIKNGADITHSHQENGDIILVLKNKENNLYKRYGPHLYRTINITLLEALTEIKIRIDEHPSNKDFYINYNKVITPETILELKGKGMPELNNGNSYGNLYINFNIKFPNNLSEQRQYYLKKLLPIRENEIKIFPDDIELTEYSEIDNEQIEKIKKQYIRPEHIPKTDKKENPFISNMGGFPSMSSFINPEELLGGGGMNDMPPIGGCTQQ
jgi:DnaJ-class molecular chaperone